MLKNIIPTYTYLYILNENTGAQKLGVLRHTISLIVILIQMRMLYYLLLLLYNIILNRFINCCNHKPTWFNNTSIHSLRTQEKIIHLIYIQ